MRHWAGNLYKNANCADHNRGSVVKISPAIDLPIKPTAHIYHLVNCNGDFLQIHIFRMAISDLLDLYMAGIINYWLYDVHELLGSAIAIEQYSRR
jgi:hypothetical protein